MFVYYINNYQNLDVRCVNTKKKNNGIYVKLLEVFQDLFEVLTFYRGRAGLYSCNCLPCLLSNKPQKAFKAYQFLLCLL